MKRKYIITVAISGALIAIKTIILVWFGLFQPFSVIFKIGYILFEWVLLEVFLIMVLWFCAYRGDLKKIADDISKGK